MHKLLTRKLLIFSLFLFVYPALAEEESDPAEIAIGERLFLETRFAHSDQGAVKVRSCQFTSEKPCGCFRPKAVLRGQL